ncbi:MAG: hypothetical protein LUG57_01930 [Oscillospiraceae bacterium]|nr:hypothetical protein [Oscillospiraceae bacterium]
MSCHDIGHGMNNVVKKVLELMDAGEISADAAKTLAYTAIGSVHFCDGNEYEASECFAEQGRCSCCLEIKPTVFAFEDCPDLYRDKINAMETVRWRRPRDWDDYEILGDTICPECLERVYKNKFERFDENV